VARVRNALDAIFRPSISVVESALVADRAQRDPQGVLPTNAEYSESIKAAAGLSARVRRLRRRLAGLQRQVLATKAGADVADKNIVDFAESPEVIAVRTRAAALRSSHPQHGERLAFRKVTLQPWMRVAIAVIVIVADWGVWFKLMTIAFALSFTKPASASDPTPVYNPEWFLGHPAEWVAAFVVPTLMAFFTLKVARIAGRDGAQRAALASHPERAEEIGMDIPPRRRQLAVLGLVLLTIGLYIAAGVTFMQSADELGWLAAVPWIVIPVAAYLVERFGHDAMQEIDDLILKSAAEVESRRQKLDAALMRAEDDWRLAWNGLDAELRQILDAASGDLALFEQILTRAHSRTDSGPVFAPMLEPAAAVVATTQDGENPARPAPVVLEAQRGLVTRFAPWLTKEIEQHVQVLADCRPPIDGGAERSARIASRFTVVNEAAIAKVDGLPDHEDADPVLPGFDTAAWNLSLAETSTR
jgi:hypothetical protein